MSFVKLQNVMEDIVTWTFENNIHALNLTCHCDKCKLDTIAIALSSLPAHYIVDKKNKTYIKAKYIEKQSEVNVLSELANAAQLVSKNPRH